MNLGGFPLRNLYTRLSPIFILVLSIYLLRFRSTLYSFHCFSGNILHSSGHFPCFRVHATNDIRCRRTLKNVFCSLSVVNGESGHHLLFPSLQKFIISVNCQKIGSPERHVASQSGRYVLLYLSAKKLETGVE